MNTRFFQYIIVDACTYKLKNHLMLSTSISDFRKDIKSYFDDESWEDYLFWQKIDDVLITVT